MIIVELKGGLGNQMFQYAVARGIRKKVFFDFSFLQNHTASNESFTAKAFELKIFNNLRSSEVPKFIFNILNNPSFIFRKLRSLFAKYIISVEQKENELVFGLKGNKGLLYLKGYFQSEKYFRHLRKSLLEEFTFPRLDSDNLNFKSKVLSSTNSVCLHVRRGDYLKPAVLNYMGLLPLSYYNDAISYIESIILEPTYFIFSDDATYCSKHFSHLKNYIIVEGNSGNDAWKDMCLMTFCKHHIIANSSFSWWGAWLSKNNEGIKIAPREWFNSSVAVFHISDFVPSTWEIL